MASTGAVVNHSGACECVACATIRTEIDSLPAELDEVGKGERPVEDSGLERSGAFGLGIPLRTGDIVKAQGHHAVLHAGKKLSALGRHGDNSAVLGLAMGEHAVSLEVLIGFAERQVGARVPEHPARTFREVNGVRYSFPGDMATVEADGTVCASRILS